MGRLNYSARKIDGVKAAQVVARDLKKRITPGSGARNTSRDPTLEIDLSDKGLTDDGFDEFIETLLECMKFRDAEHPEGAAKVTELHLSGNQLTVRSLEKLAEVIAFSVGDLREIDLSHNRIEFCDDAQKQTWFSFLRAFNECYVLKKIDFGHNNLGLKGIEMLARAYLQSELDFFEGEAGDVSGVDGDEEGSVDGVATKVNGHKENDNPGRGRSKRSPKGKARQNGNSGPGPSTTGKSLNPADLKRFACTRGLRSVPFIILSNTSLTTGAVVHLASMILAHRDPEHLLTYLPGGKTPSPTDTEGRCNGLLWLPNNGLCDLGHKMLDSAETLRGFTSEMNPEEDQLHREGKLPRDLEGINLMNLMEQRRQHTKLNIEYTRIAKRARLEALRTEGVHATQIWSAALRMITAARTVLLDSARHDADEHSESDNEHEVPVVVGSAAPAPGPIQNGVPASSSHVSNGSVSMPSPPSQPQPVQTQPVLSSANIPRGHGKKYVPFDYRSEQQPLLLTYPIPGSMQAEPNSGPSDNFPPGSSVVNEHSLSDALLAMRLELNGYSMAAQAALDNSSEFVQSGPFKRGAAAFEANFPALNMSNKGSVAEQAIDVTPQHQSQPQGQQQQSPAQSSAPLDRSNKANARQTSPDQQQKTPEKKAKEKRDWRYELPLQVWGRIIAHSIDADGVLSVAQQQRIIQYATDWKSIAAELRSQGAEKHQQIWKLLDTVNCFTYGCLS